jgi:hypothetical protein
MPRSGAVTLSDVLDQTLTLVCKPCGRKGVFSVARLQAKHGDAKLPDLRRFLSKDCPKHLAVEGVDRCQALFDPTPETRRERPTW